MGEEETRAPEHDEADEAEDEKEEERRPGVVNDVLATAEEEAEKLQEGRKLPFFGGPLPLRAVVAMGIFVAAFLVVWLILWALLGTLGLGLGWIVAAVAGFFAVKLAADRMAAG